MHMLNNNCGALLTCLIFLGATCAVSAQGNEIDNQFEPAKFLQRYCIDCHGNKNIDGLVDLTTLLSYEAKSKDWINDQSSKLWEHVVHKLQARQMPPNEAERPTEVEYNKALEQLTEALNRRAALHPKPGRTETLRRLNRTEYQNSIRDLLALDVDVTNLLPPDEISGSFDNVTVTNLSPTLLNRYITAAQKISHMAVGGKSQSPLGDTFRVRADVTQEEHIPGLPIGTRGGTLIQYNFPQAGKYEFQIRLARDRNEEVEGLREPHELQVLIDRKIVAEFTVRPPKDKNHSSVDAHLVCRIEVPAGPHQVGVTFVKKPTTLIESKREPYSARFNMHRHPRLTPAIYQVSIAGPFDPSILVSLTSTPSRARLLADLSPPGDEIAIKNILSQLARRAYRRPVLPEDLSTPMQFFREANANGSFFDGIEAALSSILVNPHFLLRVESEPDGIVSNTAYRINDIELASRLSYFLWSSLPDDELLQLAEEKKLSDPKVLEQQTLRMLLDDRSKNLVNNFAAQWLYLRNLDAITPDLRLFPDFDDNLRQAFRQETELFFESVLREDRNVLDLLSANYTYLNERLAKHYGISQVYGSRMRRVELQEDRKRGGLLRHGSILTVTSYATRTSPVIRGHWILKNLVGAPPPPPPANVPALKDNTVDSSLSIRDRLAEHRQQAACAVCHNIMDPVGFALENYDAVGRWRETEFGKAIDASGEMLDGTVFVGVAELEKALLNRSDLFESTLAEKLLTFALGRGMTEDDAPSIRKIVAYAKEHDHRFSSLIVAITQSTPFTMRTSK